MSVSTRLRTSVHLPYRVLPVYSNVFRNHVCMPPEVVPELGVADPHALCYPSCGMSYNLRLSMGGE